MGVCGKQRKTIFAIKKLEKKWKLKNPKSARDPAARQCKNFQVSPVRYRSLYYAEAKQTIQFQQKNYHIEH